MGAIAFKVLITVATAVVGICLLRSRMLAATSERSFLRAVVGAQLACSLGLFVALYLVAGQNVTSDVPAYYLPAARAALAGALPYRDFPTSYAPLFAYLGAALVFLWNSGKVFALCAILLNALALIAWHRAASACFSRQTARRCSILYATSGHLVLQALLGTQQIWIAAALAASAWLLVCRRDVSSGLVQALALCMTKFLVLLFWPILWMCAPRRARWLSAAVLLSAAVYGAFALCGADPLSVLYREGDLVSSGNLPYLLEPLLSATALPVRVVLDGGALVALAAATAWLYLRARHLSEQARPALLFAGLAVTGLVFMLVSKKSFTGYAVFFLYPAFAALDLGLEASWARVGFVLVFNVLLAAESSLWFHLGGNGRPLSLWWHTAAGPAVGGFVLVDLALIACYGYLALLSIRCVERIANGVMPRTDAHPSAAARIPRELHGAAGITAGHSLWN